MTRPSAQVLDAAPHTDDAMLRRAAINEARRRKRKSRGRGLRRTTGCLTCKRRHLKCDEASPECGACVKSRQTCLYVARDEQLLSIPTESSEIPATSGPNVPQLTSQSSPIVLRFADGVIASPDSVTNTFARSSDPFITTPPPPPPPDAAFYRWFGLLTDDVAAADVSGQSQSSSSLSTGAVGVNAPQPVVNDLSGNSLSETDTATPAVTPCVSPLSIETTSRRSWHGSQPAQLSNDELALFHNFVVSVSAWIDIHDPLSSFSTLVPHLAMHDAGLMSAILALSSRQLSIKPDPSQPVHDRSIGIQYYHNTLSYLQRAMSFDAYTVSLELLATALIVSMYEMLDDSDSGSGWGRHLKGVFWIQRSQLIQGETGGLKSAVWWAWMRQDIWAAFRERRKTLSFWTPTKAYEAMTCHEKAARIVWIFAKAVDYCSDEETAAARDSTEKRLERANQILTMLDEWHKSLPDEFLPLPMARDSNLPDYFQPLWIHPPAFGISMQLYHAARILVLLHKPSLGGIQEYVRQHKLMTTAATTICQLAATLTTPALSLMSSQCLYIAGLSFQEAEQRDRVVLLVDNCHRVIGWPHTSLSDDLREEWEKLDKV